MDLIVADGMAYLAVYIAIRTGDFVLREAALRRIAPLFLGYNKHLFTTRCVSGISPM